LSLAFEEEDDAMSHGWSAIRKLSVLAALVLISSTLVFAQGGGSSTTLGGVVVDTSGGVMPGVDVVAKHNGTGTSFQAVTDSTGRFVIPAVPPGTYTVTIALSGFKTVVLPDVTVVTNTPQSVKVTLEVGNLQETVVVTGAAEVVQTQSAEVQTTVAIKQISSLPVASRTALDYVVSLPGVETPAGVTRSSTVNGLPASSMNITLDGVNVQDKRSNTEGFYMYIRPMMDSVEEITVSTSNPGAESSGSGASQIRMTTRSGTNKFSGSIYDTWRNQAGLSDDDIITRNNKHGWLWGLNTANWFNKRDIAKTAGGDYYINDVRLSTPGFRVGGPIQKDKLFYFFNVEWFQLPESRSRTRYILNSNAQNGIFTYTADNGTTQSVNLLTLAAAKGQTATADSSISKLLGDIRTATATTGSVSSYDNLLDKYDYAPSATQKRIFPTLRIDYNVTPSHRLSFVGRYNDFDATPDFLNNAEPRFPGFPNQGAQTSGRYMWQATLRSTLGKDKVNELRVGVQDATGNGSYFGKGVSADQFNCTGLGCQSAAGRGWNFYLPSMSTALTSATAYNTQSAGVAGQFTLEDSLSWLKGKHSISAGVNFTRIRMRNWASTPTYATLYFGTASADTAAYNMLDPASGNFPGGISSTQAGYARNLYGLLTGRVTYFAGTAYLGDDGKYHYNGERTNATRADDIGGYISDSWRMKPNLTLNAGLRYEVQLPMTTDGLYSRPQSWQMVYGLTGAGSGKFGQGNLYHPGTLTGTSPVLVPYENNASAYNTDWNNVAPSVGIAWRPTVKSGLLAKILSTDPVFRGGYTLSFSKMGTAFFDSNYSGNPGRSRQVNRSITAGTPYLGSESGTQVLPVLLRDAATRLTPGTYPESPSYPITPATSDSIDIHYPDQPVPQTHQYSFGFQRALSKTMALEVRYVGNTNLGNWQSWNMNGYQQWSMLSNENGFLDEFRKAQANLRANIVAGKGTTFAYTGATGTSPLPIFMAYLQGIPLTSSANQQVASYTAAQFKNSSWYNSLSMYSPALTTIAGNGSAGLQNAAFQANAKTAGLPANFFQANPDLYQGNAYLETTGGGSRYNALQFEVRRQMSKGLLMQFSYNWAFGRRTSWQTSLRDDYVWADTTGNNPKHAFKVNWAYELPFGQGRKWGSGAGRIKNMLIGDWELDGVARIQSGAVFNYGNFRLVGMTEDEFQDMFKFYHVTGSDGVDRVYMLPQDVIENSIKAIYGTSATTSTGYVNNDAPVGRYLALGSDETCVQYLSGQCPGTKLVRPITGPKYAKVDMSFVKRFAIVKNVKVEARMNLYNIFDAINFMSTAPTTSIQGNTGWNYGIGSAVSNWQVTSAASDVNGSQDPGGRITEFGLRVSW
jgi:hypothetical protein